MGLTTFIITVLDPFGIIRRLFFRPVVAVTSKAFDRCRTETNNQISSAKEFALKASVVAIISAVIIWIAVFLYLAFYYSFIPTVAHTRPVYMQFESCTTKDQKGPCSFPYAHVPLTKRQQLLMVGQPYRVYLSIDMPESPQNQELGMFMVCGEMRDHLTKLRDHSCRAAMLHYKSSLIRTMTTLIMSPLYVMGFKEESQQVLIELFTNYEDDQSHPATDVYIELQSKELQYYSITLHITAHFTGLRYIMFHWPIFSAVIGICANLFFIIILSILSWYHWGDYIWIDDFKDIFLYKAIKRNRNKREYSTSVDESNKILDDDDIISLTDDHHSTQPSDSSIENKLSNSG
ncbi:Seipin [Pseudolycoriella hygida]|uniref:Seipin n=1 Tax=Pseudolycoriella hygida TaxID=35572 RepID=A0A9Q0MUK5_9DIPT|nr:Seipin [Pseudolycoriella hygida]